MKPYQASVAVAPDTFPKWVLQAMGALLLFALLSVAAVRITGNGPDQLRSVVVTERSLRFEDRPDGGIAVIDGVSGKLLVAVHGEQGFLRGVVRALARERRTRDMGPEQPFLLTAPSWPPPRLTSAPCSPPASPSPALAESRLKA